MESKINRHLTLIPVILVSLYYCLVSATPQHGGDHFVLVHGGGHNVTAVDLAASGIDLRRAESLRSFAQYIGPLMSLMETLSEDEKVILVAHSLGGLAISKAMEIFHDKIHMAIFVTALMPSLAFNFTILSQGVWAASTHYPINTVILIFVTLIFEDVELAELLVRPQRLFSNENIYTSLVLTPERFGSVNRIFVLSDKDRTLVKEFQLWMIKNNPPNHVEHIQDSDHMVMISKPDLGDYLLSLAKKFA
ncbi:hypothetical protein HID58_011511 [Brassica napus]|uniref:AB hydrolase-1 domain-containing protein n=1 Tax=Brassica napus TaxID=3708 RepID=A0ABQ8DYJ6_BRANA|nr:hypothetical protein HID58_011511 [Brassica napus]